MCGQDFGWSGFRGVGAAGGVKSGNSADQSELPDVEEIGHPVGKNNGHARLGETGRYLGLPGVGEGFVMSFVMKDLTRRRGDECIRDFATGARDQSVVTSSAVRSGTSSESMSF